MKLSSINESKFIKVTGGAHGDAKYPYDFPHVIADLPKYLFHGTSSLSISGIKRTGLSEKNHLTNQMSLANFSAYRAVLRFGGEPMILKIDTTNLEDLSLGGVSTDFHILKPIPPEAIVKISSSKMKSDSPKLDIMKKTNKFVGKQSYHEEPE